MAARQASLLISAHSSRMDLQPTYNKFGSPEKFYRFQTKNSATTYNSDFGFLAGDYHNADEFQDLDYDEQRSIVEDHSNWSNANASPFISTTSDLEWALSVAKGMTRMNPIHIAEISPGCAVSGSMLYYHWFELVHELDADIVHTARNYHETVFLNRIPQEAITWYGRVEEAERHFFEDEDEDEDFEDEDEEYEYEEDDEEEDEEDEEDDEDDEEDDEDEEDENEKGDGPLFSLCSYINENSSAEFRIVEFDFTTQNGERR